MTDSVSRGARPGEGTRVGLALWNNASVAEASPKNARRAAIAAAAEALEETPLRLPFDDRAERDRARVELANSIRRYLLPRLGETEAPVVVVFVGLSGTGKSTLFNSLAGRKISPAGPMRPTTRDPVIWAHRRHAGRYWSEFVARLRERIGPTVELILDEDPLVAALTLVDSPPPDHFDEHGRSQALELVSEADLCVFVASTSRYADSAGWDLMRSIRDLGIPMLHVLNRLPPDATSSTAISADYAGRLAEEGYLGDPDPELLFPVYDQHVDISTTGLAARSVAAIRKELEELADPEFRTRLQETAMRALVAELADRAQEVRDYVIEEYEVCRRLRALVGSRYRAGREEAARALEEGRFAFAIDTWDEGGLTGALTREIGKAAQESAAAWAADPIGVRLLEGEQSGLWRHGPDAAQQIGVVLEGWEAGLERRVVEWSKRGRLWPRKRRRLAEAVRRSALRAPDAEPDAEILKSHGAEGAQMLVPTGRVALSQAIEDAFAQDRARFEAVVGDPEQLRALATTLEDRAADLESLIEELAR